MKRTFLYFTLVCILITSFLLAACTTKTTSSTATTTTSSTPASTTQTTAAKPVTSATVQPTSTGSGPATTSVVPGKAHWWDKLGTPKYGGSLSFWLNADIMSFDTYAGQVNGCAYFDAMGGFDRTLDPSVCSYNTGYYPSTAYISPISESWETPDFATFTFHLRQGVKWWNVAPVNGRELTADDVVYSYHRVMGNGDGFTVPARFFMSTGWLQLESITATDKYTIVFKFKKASINNLLTILEQTSCNHITGPKEAVSTWGQPGAKDWTQIIGTGAFMIGDYTSGASYTLVKNPDYWGFDDRYPENKLPYLDELKFLIIPDASTALAATRSGRLDRMGGTVETISWQNAKVLKESNPDIVQVPVPVPANGIALRCDLEPFTDIKVRIAMQQAIDLQSIAKNYYNGVDWKPWGTAGTQCVEVNNPYDTWPAELQAEYAYNLGSARKLLTEAGYPNGFQTVCTVSSAQDLNLLQIMKANLKDIAIDMEIKTVSPVEQQVLTGAGKYDMLFFPMGMAENKPVIRLAGNLITGYPNNFPRLSDPVYDKMYNDWLASTNWEDANRIGKEIDMYVIKGHYRVTLMPYNTFMAYSSSMGGGNGEAGQQEQYHFKYYWKK